MNLSNFKPNLIPNSPKDGSFDIHHAINMNGGPENYMILDKKDGCRLELVDGKVLSRSLKAPGSKIVVKRFQSLAIQLHELGLALEGEFYMHGQKFNSIFRFFSKSDVTCPKYKLELEKAQKKDPVQFAIDYDGLSIDFLTVFHDDLKFFLFDGIVLDRPDLVNYHDRMQEITKRLKEAQLNFHPHISMPNFYQVDSLEQLDLLYEDSLEGGYEGLVLTHKEHQYKYGRNTLKQATILKMKDDALEYDGVIIDIAEATSIKDGVERTVNELGRSVTSKKKGDRELSGLAKGLVVQFSKEDGTYVGTFPVGLRSFNNEQKAELLKNKANYIGRHFRYTGMKPVKDFPRHAYFDCWRDEK